MASSSYYWYSLTTLFLIFGICALGVKQPASYKWPRKGSATLLPNYVDDEEDQQPTSAAAERLDLSSMSCSMSNKFDPTVASS
jgi:hypothetical protein